MGSQLFDLDRLRVELRLQLLQRPDAAVYVEVVVLHGDAESC